MIAHAHKTVATETILYPNFSIMPINNFGMIFKKKIHYD